jgi:Ca2+-binding EF-hand superfamily protein
MVDMLFIRYDKDKNGYLDVKELKNMIKSLANDGINKGPTEIEIVSFTSQIDANHNGKIDKKELFNFLKNSMA